MVVHAPDSPVTVPASSDHSVGRPLQPRGPRTFSEIIRRGRECLRDKVALQMRQPGGVWSRLTYGELADAGEQFAAGLLARGFAPGDHAAIVLENGLEWAIAYCGVAVAGGAVVPIYYELRGEEIGYILRESDSRVAIVSPAVLGKLPARDAVPRLEQAIIVDAENARSPIAVDLGAWDGACTFFSEVQAAGGENARAKLAGVRVEPDQPLQILYTSGTTGNPKGVVLTHENVTANVEQARRRLKLTQRDHLLHVLPLHHAMTLLAGIGLPLAAGATVTYENDLRRIQERMAEVKPTIFLAVPALYGLMLRRILDRAESEGHGKRLRAAMRLVERVKRMTGINVGPLLFRNTIHRRLGGNLRFLASGSAALPPDVARQYFQLGLLMIQGYGMSETSPVMAVQEASRLKFLFTRHYEQQLGTVGRPVDGLQLRLADAPEKNIIVAERGEGEIVVSGPNVMAGYYKNEQATQGVLSFDGKQRWLRTGDLGRIDAQGNVYITGRAKDVIVLASGEKVYPDEVEEKLLESGLVEELAVVDRVIDQDARQTSQAVAGRPAAAEALGRVQACVVVFPRFDALYARAERDGRVLTPELVREWMVADLRQHEKDIAPYKRMSEIFLVDSPLPKTPMRKVKRFEVSKALRAGLPEFSVERLKENAPAPAMAAPVPRTASRA